MAHELTINDEGAVEMFYAGSTPWHGLGTAVQEAQTSTEALKLANLDWEVGREEILTPEHEIIENFKRIFRKDNNFTLGIMTNMYEPLQNADAFLLLDELVNEQLAMYVTAGSIRGGKQVWALAKLPNHITVGEGDRIENYLLMSNSHDGSSAIQILSTPIRVVCNNTLSYALKSATNRFAWRHTGNVFDRLDDAKEALNIINNRFIELETELQPLYENELSDDEYMEYIEEVLDVNPEKQEEKIY